MYISKLSMPRRTFLRGVGTAMALRYGAWSNGWRLPEWQGQKSS